MELPPVRLFPKLKEPKFFMKELAKNCEFLSG
jgi:hypothetical protein